MFGFGCLGVKLGDRFPKGQELSGLGIKLCQALPEQFPDVRARRLASVADVQDLPDLGEGEPCGLAAVDETDPAHDVF